MKKYVTLLSPFLVFLIHGLVTPTQAQIFYQDIDPDVVISTWDVYDVHIDSLATASLSYGDPGNLSIWQEFGTQITIKAFSACEVVKDGTLPAAMSYMDPVDASLGWLAPSYHPLNMNGTTGNWIGLSDHYLGVRIDNGTHYNYGWIRLDVNAAGNSVTIKDYACQRTPGAMIYAGQTTATGLLEKPGRQQAARITVNPVTDRLFLSGNILPGQAFAIYDAHGQLVQEGRYEARPVTLSQSGPGLYIFRLNGTDRGLKFIRK